jgi:CRP-like cAMP-binding protein
MLESKYLKDDIKNIQQLLAIPTLKGFETEDLSKLITLSKIRRYEDREVIIREGDLDQWLYFLLSGKVRISKSGVAIGILERKGDFFGEMRFIDGLNRAASVHAQGHTVCLAVNLGAKNRLDPNDANRLLMLLYKMVSEFISVRLRLSNDNLIMAKEEIHRLKY